MKGVIYFQAIEEVYYDHLKNAHKVSHFMWMCVHVYTCPISLYIVDICLSSDLLHPFVFLPLTHASPHPSPFYSLLFHFFPSKLHSLLHPRAPTPRWPSVWRPTIGCTTWWLQRLKPCVSGWMSWLRVPKDTCISWCSWSQEIRVRASKLLWWTMCHMRRFTALVSAQQRCVEQRWMFIRSTKNILQFTLSLQGQLMLKSSLCNVTITD